MLERTSTEITHLPDSSESVCVAPESLPGDSVTVYILLLWYYGGKKKAEIMKYGKNVVRTGY